MYQKSPVASMYTLSSTHAGGALLWAATELSTFLGLIPVFMQWSRADTRAGGRADVAQARPARAGAAQVLAPAPSAVEAPDAEQPAELVTPRFAQQFRPILQAGNSSWEAMWKAKAGFVPSSRGARPNSPPLRSRPAPD